MEFKRTKMLLDVPFHYCPGCTHGIAQRLVAEVIEELGIQDKTVGVAPVGCAVFLYDYLDCDMIGASHGRAPAVATGAKRVLGDDKVVFSYQGDGEVGAIGTAEIVHAAARGENIVSIFINNAVYGMTGGQMAPTTVAGQVTTTTPGGRDPKVHGMPVKVSEMLAALEGPYYIERVALNTPANVRNAKKAIKKAFQYQMEGKGFCLIEILSSCPTNWGLPPVKAIKWLEEKMIPYYPLGVKKEGRE